MIPAHPDPSFDMKALVSRQRSAFLKGGSPTLADRKARLKRLRRAVLAHRRPLAVAISADFGHRSRHETDLMEIVGVIQTIDYLIRNLRRFMKPERHRSSKCWFSGTMDWPSSSSRRLRSQSPPVADISHQVWIRALDTILGCAIVIVVFVLLAKRGTTRVITQELVLTWGAIDLVAQYLASGDADTAGVRSARRNLQHHTILLLQSFDTAAGSSAESRIAENRSGRP